jgi:hypothetical protein
VSRYYSAHLCWNGHNVTSTETDRVCSSGRCKNFPANATVTALHMGILTGRRFRFLVCKNDLSGITILSRVMKMNHCLISTKVFFCCRVLDNTNCFPERWDVHCKKDNHERGTKASSTRSAPRPQVDPHYFLQHGTFLQGNQIEQIAIQLVSE